MDALAVAAFKVLRPTAQHEICPKNSKKHTHKYIKIKTRGIFLLKASSARRELTAIHFVTAVVTIFDIVAHQFCIDAYAETATALEIQQIGAIRFGLLEIVDQCVEAK